MTRLFICEKHSQAQDIAKVLGNPQHVDRTHYITAGGIVAHASGHLLELAPPDHYKPEWKQWSLGTLPIIPPRYEYDAVARTRPLLSAIGKLLKQASEVIIATDADREGELIAVSILERHGYRGPTQRLWLRQLDPASIRKALSNLRDGATTKPLALAARARQQADWAVGLNLTRGATTALLPRGAEGIYSIGRVQTPTLALVVNRDREIASFKSRDYYDLVAETLSAGQRFQLVYAPKDDNRIFERARAEQLAAVASGTEGPLEVEKKECQTAPPRPFSLSALQKRCNVLFGWTADQTLTHTQSLYERHKVVSYPRSDCSYIPDEQIEDVPAIVGHLCAGLFKHLPPFTPVIRKTVFDSAKITAHHAIIPTKLTANVSALSADEAKCYLLICAHYLASLLPDYRYLRTKYSMAVAGVVFEAIGLRPLAQGWKVVFGHPDIQAGAQDAEDPGAANLPDVPPGSGARIESVQVRAGKTRPPAYYTEATLIGDMEDIAKFVTDPRIKEKLRSKNVAGTDATRTPGIGTEATRADILKTLRARGYLDSSKKSRQIRSSEKGRTLIETLRQSLPGLIDPGVTALWEFRQEEIIAGSITVEDFMEAIHRQVTQQVGYLQQRNPGAAAPVQRTSTPLTVSCPKSGQPIEDCGKYWRFPGLPKVCCWKVIAQRQMRIEDYVSLFSTADGTSPAPLEGFVSAKGRPFAAPLRYNPKAPDSRYIEFAFAEQTARGKK